MTWTSTIPTVPGWYWLRLDDVAFPFERHADDTPAELADWKRYQRLGCKFCGPIEVPTMEERP